MMQLSDVVFTVINYTIYVVLLWRALNKFIIPYFVHEQADEFARSISLQTQRERANAASVHLSAQQQFFTAAFDKFSRYIDQVKRRLSIVREDAAVDAHARQASYRKRYIKIYEQHLVTCQYRTLVPEVVSSAERKLKEYYQDQRNADRYFERLMKSMREKS